MIKRYLLFVTFIGAFLMIAGFAQATFEASSSNTNETMGVKSTLQTQVKATPNSTNTENQTKENTIDTQRVLPTVNKKNTVAKIEIRGWDPDKKEEILSRVEATLENNPQITSAQISEDSVNLNYSAPAKFLGFIHVTMNINVSSDTTGRVKVKFPWYKFLLSTDFSDIAEELNGVFQNNQSNFEFLKLQDTAQRQTQLLETISNILKAKYDASLQAISNIK